LAIPSIGVFFYREGGGVTSFETSAHDPNTAWIDVGRSNISIEKIIYHYAKSTNWPITNSVMIFRLFL
jgi:hypothetical protein